MKPINQEQVVQTAQIILAVLSDEEGSTPNKYLEGIVSGKSLLRGIVAGQLVVCAPGKPEPEKVDAEVDAKEDGSEQEESAAPADKD